MLPSGIRRASRLAPRRPRIDDEVADEVAFCLAMRAAEPTARGLSPEAARARPAWTPSRCCAVVPPHVEYSLTPLGCEAAARVRALADWIETSLPRVARQRAERRPRNGAVPPERRDPLTAR